MPFAANYSEFTYQRDQIFNSSLAGKSGAVSSCLTRDEQDHLLIVVSDNGIGIDVKNHQDIFEPFMQLGNGAGLDFGGTGLGLTSWSVK